MTTGPLAGVRVVELGGLGPGPFAGMLLADLGAEVVRVDRPERAAEPDAGGPADVLNRGKRSVVLDLKDPSGTASLLQLVERADVLIEGFRPSVTERLGIGPHDCLARNPRLVYGRMTGWGQDGPLAATAGHDLTYIALTGALGAIGDADGPPQIPLNLVGDFGGGGCYLVIGVLAALHVAARTGRGQVVDAAIVDGTAHLLASTFAKLGRGSGATSAGSTGSTADGRSTPCTGRGTAGMWPWERWSASSTDGWSNCSTWVWTRRDSTTGRPGRS